MSVCKCIGSLPSWPCFHTHDCCSSLIQFRDSRPNSYKKKSHTCDSKEAIAWKGSIRCCCPPHRFHCSGSACKHSSAKSKEHVQVVVFQNFGPETIQTAKTETLSLQRFWMFSSRPPHVSSHHLNVADIRKKTVLLRRVALLRCSPGLCEGGSWITRRQKRIHDICVGRQTADRKTRLRMSRKITRRKKVFPKSPSWTRLRFS